MLYYIVTPNYYFSPSFRHPSRGKHFTGQAEYTEKKRNLRDGETENKLKNNVG